MIRTKHQYWCLGAVLCCLYGAFQGVGQVPYFTDFEGGIGPGWSLSNLETNETTSFTRFTGRFSNEAQTLTLTNLVVGQSHTVGFDFYAIDSWDGNAAPGDYFNVSVATTQGTNQVFHETFSNYNGNPPSQTQTYPNPPDEGRANFGFVPSYVDAIYRNIEIAFTASNSTVQIIFQGQNIQTINDESWGIDNVQVRLTSALPPTAIQTTTLPTAGSTNAITLERFTIAATRDLLSSPATNATNYVLREAGVNGTFSDGDDTIYTLVPSQSGLKTVIFTFTNSPLQPGNYRFETKTNLLDKNSLNVSAFTRQFVITNPIFGKIESTSNDTIPTATALPMTETPPGSGFFTALGIGTFATIVDADYWRFDAEAGDNVTIRLEADTVGVYPLLYLQDASGQNLITANGDFAGVVQIQNYRFNSPGTYYLRVFSNNGTARYQMRIDQARALQLETEANDSQVTANVLNITTSAGAYQAKVAGALVGSDAAGDYFRIGTLNPGNAISANLVLPGSSTLAATNVTLTVELEGNGVAVATNTTGSLNYTVASNGMHYVRIQSPANLNLRAQYILNINITDGVAPVIASLTFPSEGGVTSDMVDRVTIGLSEEVDAAFNGLNRRIWTFGTNAYLITDTTVNWSPAESQAQNLGGHLATINSAAENTFIRDTFSGFGTLWTGFTDQAVEGAFDWISGEPVTFANWNSGEPNNGGGANEDYASFLASGLWNDAGGGNNYRGVIEVAGTDSDADGLPNTVDPYPTDPLNAFDLRAAGVDGLFDTPDDQIYHFASYGYLGGLLASLRVVDGPLQPGNYRFTITTSLRDRAGNALSTPFVRLFTVSGVSGFTVENRTNDTFIGATSLSVSPTNSSDGSFTGTGSIPVGINPYFVLAGLLNDDANLDLITANNGSDNVSVLLGNGNGTFQPATSFTTGNGPIALALGTVNNDTNADLLVANNSANSVSVLLGDGNGTFGTATNFSVGSSPRSVKLGDFNGDGKLDFVTANSGSANLSVALGNGDGSFGSRTNFATASGPYGVAVADFNADGKLDVAVANQSADNVSILLGNGNGSFGAPTNFPVGSTPRSVAVGDLNGDGKPDVAVVNASDNQVSVLIGVGNGSFAPATNYPSGGSGSYHGVIADVDADGNQDVVVAGYGNNVVGVLRGNGNGTMKPVVTFGIVSNPISVAAGDYNGDGRPDIATANISSHNVGILLGNNTEPLVEDPPASGIRTGTGRGNLNTSSDVDYWSFTGTAGDLFSLAVDNPGNPAASGLYYRIYRPDGALLTEFVANSEGWGQSVPAILPLDGTYVVQVSVYNDYQGEYRLRVTTARPPTQMESEANNNVAQADAPTLVLTAGHQTAKVLGYVSAGDLGDYYLLGNLAEGTTITLGLSRPASSGLAGILSVLNASGVAVINSAVRATSLTYTIPAGGGGTYYARVISDDFGVAQQFGGTNGYALRLDGLNNHASVTDSVSLRPTSLTLEGWFNFSAVGGTRVMLGKTLGSSVNNSYVLWHDAGRLRAGSGDIVGFTEVNFPWTPQLGVWYHLAYTFDSASDLQSLYINGVQQTNNVNTRNVAFDNHPFLIGADINNEIVNAFFAGKVDEARVWNVVRSQAQISASMSQSLVGNESGLIGYWRFDEGTGVTAFDATANGNNGTLFNNPVWAPSGLTNVQPAGLLAQYILDLDLADTLPPAITTNNLPIEGSTNAIIVDRFALGFSEDMDAASVTNSANYDLRAAGPDTLFDTGDDEIYTVTSTGYASGLTGSYVVSDGPLQPGRYRFTAKTALQDRYGNGLAAPHVRQFSVIGVSGFVFESRNNDTRATATSFSVAPGIGPDGSFTADLSFGVGAAPQFVAAGFLNPDAHLDLVTANSGSGNISVLVGNGDGTFQVASNYSAGNGTIAVAIGDVNGDGKADVVTANDSGSNVSVLLGNGNATFQPATNFAVGGSPRSVALADFNGDGILDLVVANVTSHNVSVLLGTGSGAFGPRTNFATGNTPFGLAVADFNGDSKADLVVANQFADNVGVLLGNGNGSFGTMTNFAVGSNPRSVAIGDLNGDGKLDLAVVNSGNNTVSVLFGNNDGSFAPATGYPTAGSDPYQIILADLNGDGRLDVAVPNFGSSRVSVLLNQGAGSLSVPANFVAGNRPISVVPGDFNHDGRLDLATANYSGNNVTVLFGNNTELLMDDPASSGIRHGWVRGNVSTGTDIDYWSFSGKAGYLVTFAMDAPGNPNASGLAFALEAVDGVSIGNFYSDFNGRGESSPFLLSADGTYTVRVSWNYGFFGEYRLRVTTAPPPIQMESENNDSTGAADVPVLAFSTGQQSATVLGYIRADDPGDYYRVGNQAVNTEIRLVLSQPVSSGLSAVMGIYNSSGALVTNSVAEATSLNYMIPTGGTYYARVTAAGGTGGLSAQYILSLVLADTLPPLITSNNLPAEGSTNAIIVDRFALGFSEDMTATTVTNAANYDLRSAGPDNSFDTGDDEVYAVLCTGYSSGLSASYLVTDGPLQPGRHRFTAKVALQDRYGNGLAAPHVRLFVVQGVSGFVFESRNNNSATNATSLSTSPLATPDGSFTTGNTDTAGANPHFVVAGLLNADANLDVVTANNGSSDVTVLLGNGDGTFQPGTNYATGSGPIALALGDLNGDGKADIVVANNSANTVSVLPGNGNGSFQPATNYSVGTNPRSVKLADLNGDGKPDIVTANQNSDNVSVLLGNGNGTFQTRVNYASGDGPHGIAVADLNGDGRLDLVTVNLNSDNLSLFLGNGDGTFGGAASLAAEQSPRSVAIGDVNGDSLPDIATVNAANNTVSVLFGTGGASFASRVNYFTGGSDPYHIVLADMDADGALDVLVANYGSSRVALLLNAGNGVLLPAANYAGGNRPIAIATGDFDSDGRVDVVTAAHAGNSATIILSNDTEPLTEDPTGSSVRSGFGRGNVFSTSDQDYWSFSGRAGDLLSVAVDVPGNPGASGLYFRIDRPDGVFLTDFYGDQAGWGQSAPVTLPVDGTYTVRVSYNYQYFGEYRIRVTLAQPPLQMESEDNNNLAQADAPTFTAIAGHQTATLLGYVSAGDTSGDYYRLGTLVEGTTVGLSLGKPNGSELVAVLGIYNSAGVTVATGTAGVTNLAYTIPAAGDGIYYSRVTASGGTSGLAAQYFLAIDLADTRPTAVTVVSLPAEGATASNLIDRFTLSVNKDLDPAFNALNQDIPLRNGHAYLLTGSAMTWAAAESQAQSAGGHLATINDQAENDWVQQNFAAGGTVWIDLTDEALEGAFVWASGEPFAYTNWNSGQPDNSGNQDYASMLTNGKWDDASGSTSYPGVTEVAGADSDADGLPNTVDTYPVDPINVFELRSAGADSTFGTPDDQVYRLKTANYAAGLALSFTVSDGPLQAGNYRFTVSTSLRDRFGNTLSAPFVRFFTVASVPGYTVENRNNDLRTNATALVAVEDPAGLKSAGGRGKLFFQFETDYWSFNGNTGELFSLGVEVPGSPGNSSLAYRVEKPDGTLLTDFTSANNGVGQSALVVLPTNGTYAVRVTYNNNFQDEYRLRAFLAVSPMQLESEENGAVTLATPLTLATSGDTRFGSAGGYVRASGDLDYFSLGVITNGSTIFLSTRLPATSGLLSVVGIYNSANTFIGETAGGRSDDGVGEVRITQTGSYYAVVRGGSGSGGLSEQYVLDVQVVPTGTVSFPNLQVVSITTPSGSGILSGQPVNFSFTIQNVGSAVTPTANWVDRVVISQNTIIGDGDDHQLGVFPHTGVLNSGQNYVVNQAGTLPDGISGPYYLIVKTDSGNAINEFVLEGDNVTASSSTFSVNLAPYPDLKVENLAVTGPNSSNVFSVSWTTANRGNLAANGGFKEQLLVRNLTTGAILLDVTRDVPGDLAVNGTLPQSATVTATTPGNYQAQVTTDIENRFFEFDAVSHASAEQNTAAAGFQILQYFNVTLLSNPAGGGTVSGGGSLAANSIATATAAPNTNTLPYQFVNWTENGVFQSASTNFSFTVVRDRQLVANFTLPSFQITAANNPTTGGTVTGTGTYFYGSTNVLRAVPNAGYLFTNWTENAAVIATAASLTNVVYSNRFVVANYIEANPFHGVTTATLPPGLATVTGAGTYNNGQTATFTAPTAVTNPPNIYTFHRFTLNSVAVSTNVSFNKTFSTADPANVAVVAEYDTRSIVPQIVDAYGVVTNAAIGGYSVLANPVAALPYYQLVIRFDRSMRTVPEPLVALTNPAAATQPNVPTGGVWFTTSTSNDTYRTPAIAFTSQHNGTNEVLVSRAQDNFGSELAETNAFDVIVDAIAPVHPVLSLVSSNSSSATLDWSGYAAPADLGGFRVFLGTNNFNSLAGLTPLTAVASGARSFLLSGLALDTQYYVAIAAVDVAGNSAPAITPLPILLTSTIPPAVTPVVSIGGPNTALVNWTYNTGPLLGFSGFRLYVEEANFTSVTGLTPKAELGPPARSAQVDALDRAKTYYIAVVGYNVNNGFNPNVTTGTWSDPLAGTLTANLTIGGSGQTVDIYQNVTVSGNAVLTIQPGTTLRFAPGTGLTVQQGRLLANGTALDPIIFTSVQDVDGGSPAADDWNGVLLGNAAGSSSLRHVFVKYGRGLTLDGVAPAVVAFSALNNAPYGLNLINGASLTTSEALLLYNDTGARQADTAQLVINSSVIKLNGTNAQAGGTGSLVATQNWWGTAVQADIASHVVGSVDFNNSLSSEPILTPAIGTVSGVTQVGSRNVSLRLASRTAAEMRVSEDSAFVNVFFAPFTNATAFQLSDGGGVKTVFAQFRSITGQTSAPVNVAITYITAGPTISALSLSEGQVLNRPLIVTGSASAPLGMAAVEFYVDNVGQGTNVGGTFSQLFDVRNLSAAVHRVKLLARDTAGNFATLERNVVIAPEPPPAPAITDPPVNLAVNTNTLRIAGTAEPLVEVRLFRSGNILGSTNASAAGTFSFANVPLIEGANAFTALAIDALGSASSPVRNVTLDTIPPAPLLLDPASYYPGQGLTLTWRYTITGKRAIMFRVFWSPTTITNVSQAIGTTLLLPAMTTTLQGMAAGNYYFYVVGYDALGNPSPLSAPVQFFYDGSPPAFTVTFDKPSPVGVGPLRVTLASSEPVSGVPSTTIQMNGNAPVSLTLTNIAVNTFAGTINVTPFLPSGPVALNVSAQDTAGNPFNGPPSGPALSIDVKPPSGAIGTAPGSPVQATNDTAVAVNLRLTEAPKAGTVPTLNFSPPVGASVPVPMSGGGTNWNGPLTVTPAMGSGLGYFTLSVTDALDNVGQSLTTGSTLEIYNTALPSPPAQPVGFQAASLSGGRVQLNWLAVSNAEIYRVYSAAGTNLVAPTNLVADNVISNSYIDLPPVDGFQRYVVSAWRRGAGGLNSIVRVALSDRTPPLPPTSVAAQLVANGVQISWLAGSGETPNRYHVYRNGTLVRTASSATPVIDAPPRGVMNYTVAAVDALGNEALSAATSIELLVGAINNLLVLANDGQPPALSWTSDDSTAVGFNVYRNGTKQNSAPLPGTDFIDTLPASPSVVQYAVRAVNNAGQESAPRSVDVHQVALQLLANPAGSAESNPLVTRYFDQFGVTVSNLTAAGSLPLRQLELHRTLGGASPLTMVQLVNQSLAAGTRTVQSMVLPCATVVAGQAIRLRAVQETDLGGSSVIYQRLFDFNDYASLGIMIQVTANQLPLAGGLAAFELEIFNRGYADMNVIVSRNNGADPGDIYLSVKDAQGQEVSRGDFNGTPVGTTFLPSGVGYITVAPGASRRVTVANVLVPEALAANASVTFEGAVSRIYHQIGTAGQIESGPLSGTMNSALAVTDYYGTAQTDKPGYANEEPVIITGQAIQRSTGLPLPNTNLKIGFATGGFRWYREVTTDSSGNYQYVFNPAPGLGGFFKIWAAHPLVFDSLNQAEIAVYRLYASPPRGDIRMSKNDSLGFSISLINPGDSVLTGFTAGFRAYRFVGTNQVPETRLNGSVVIPPGFSIGPRESRTINLQVNADADAPDNAVVEFTLQSVEGAAAFFVGATTLLPAVPVLTVIDPTVGYLETSLDRGDILSRSVTVMNRGLKDLKGVELIAPTNVTWMIPNLPLAPDGRIRLPDIGVGQSNTFTIVFTPPTNTPLAFYQDQIVIKGTNSPAAFTVNLYALVTSDKKGAVQFYVENILGQAVPNATVRMRSQVLQAELPPVLTDANGLVTVNDLQEGQWSWMASAPGHSSKVGTVEVVPNQTVQVAPPESRLSKSLVTVNFRVEPVPYTDRYEIKIEQTFETHVPAPVLVVDPVYKQFNNVQPGFEANYIVTVKNHGLLEMTDVTLTGGDPGWGTLTPLITYIPVLLPQQSVEVPFRATYSGVLPRPLGSQAQQFDGGGFADCATGGMAGLADAMAGIQAIANAQGRCISDQSAVHMAQGILAAYTLYQAAGLVNPVAFVGNLLSCLGQQLFPAFGGGSSQGASTGAYGPATQNATGAYSTGGPECFVAGTRVLVANGEHKAIELIRTNDIVRTGTKSDNLAVVTEVHSRLTDKVRAIRLVSRDPDAAAPVVRTTDEHLFWVDGKGWTAARDLTPGDWLFSENGGRVRIAANDRLPQTLRVYTFRLREDSAFYADGVLVHDMCGVRQDGPSRITAEAKR